MQNETYQRIPGPKVVEKTITALLERNILAEVVSDRKAALARIRELIPKGAEVMTASSTTLEEIGFVDLLKSGQHPWRNLKDAIVAEQDKEKQGSLRQQSVFSEYFLGSVHAVTQQGDVFTASGSGSQIPAYAYTSPNVLWLVGTHKIVEDFNAALTRLREYCLPKEDARMKSVGAPGSAIRRILINEREFKPGRLRIIFINEVLGF